MGVYVGRAIESVLAQTYAAHEVLVVDDGSTDNTAEEVRKFGERIRYIYQENSGVAAARNNGVTEARGDWVAFLDADDEWLPSHLERYVAVLQEHVDLVWCTGNYYRQMAEEDLRREDMKISTLRKVLKGHAFCKDYFSGYCLGAGGHTNTMLIQREVILAVGGFRKIVSPAEDVDLWFRVGLRYPKVGYVIEPTAVYYLSRAGSLMVDHRSRSKLAVNQRVLLDTYREAEGLGMADRFRPAGELMARGLIRGCLFESAAATDVKEFVKAVSFLLPSWYAAMVTAALRMPELTAWGLRLVSKIVRVLKLRRRIVSPPRPLKQK